MEIQMRKVRILFQNSLELFEWLSSFKVEIKKRSCLLDLLSSEGQTQRKFFISNLDSHFVFQQAGERSFDTVDKGGFDEFVKKVNV